MMKKLLAIVLTIAMMLSVVGMTALADTVTDYTELVEALKNGGMVVLGNDILVEEMIEIPVGTTLTLDLNGNNITSVYQTGSESKHIYPLSNYGTLTIIDNVGGGSITGRGIYNQDGATLTVDGCKIVAEDWNGGACIWGYGSTSKVFLNNATLIGNTGCISSEGYVEISGGNFTCYSGIDDEGTQIATPTYNIRAYNGLKVTDATMTSRHGVLSIGGGEAEINGGNYTIEFKAATTSNVVYIYGNSNVVINNGSFLSNNDSGKADSGAAVLVSGSNATVTINDGTFEGMNGMVSGNANTTILGGKYNIVWDYNHYGSLDEYIPDGLTTDEEGNVVVDEASNVVAFIGKTGYESLGSALASVNSANGSSVTIELLKNCDVSGWEAINWDSYAASGADYVTINGNNHTINGLDNMLFSRIWTGKNLTINNLTISGAKIIVDAEDTQNIGVGAIVGNVSALESLVLNNVHLVDSYVEGGHWTGGLFGYCAGYSGNDGPVFTEIEITNCSVKNTDVKGRGSVGGMFGHAMGDAWTKIDVTETEVFGNDIISTDDANNKAGAICGTIGVGGTDKETNGVTHTGGLSVSAAVEKNTVTSNGTTITTVYGRQGSEGGAIVVTGGSYDKKPIADGDAFAKVADGFALVENNGTYGLTEASNVVAKIGNENYVTLASAFANVQEGETITLTSDATIEEETIKLPATLKHVTLTGEDASNMPVIKDTVIMAADGTSIDYEYVTINGIVFDNSYISITGWRTGGVIIENLVITNNVFENIDNATNTAAVHLNLGTNEPAKGFVFEGNTINGALGGSKSGLYLQATGETIVKNNTINNVAFRPFIIQLTTDDGIADSLVVEGNTFADSAAGRLQALANNNKGTDKVNLVVTDNIIKGITDAQQICYWNFNEENTTTNFSRNYYDINPVENYDRFYYNTAATSYEELIGNGFAPYYTELLDDGTIDYTSLYYGLGEGVYVEFEEVADNDNKSLLYNINLVAKTDDAVAVINRLTSADLTFKLSDDSTVAYEILKYGNVNYKLEGTYRYLFNLNGVVTPDETGDVITIGQVKLTGYGKANFIVEDVTTNIVNATTLSDNIVSSYVPTPGNNEGKLYVNTAVIDTRNEVPTHNLTVEVAFNNKVVDEAAFKNMKVTISGGDIINPVELILAEGTKLLNGYSIEKVLTENIAYNVTVTGDGYRTARYTVTMTGDKTLTFWNNLKDAAEAIETDSDVKVKSNFLAGEIVADNDINIYDLSAVVSYFGKKDLTAADIDFIKYDLNRDGKINSVDVSFVLASWAD